MAQQWLATLAEVRRQAARVAAKTGVQTPDTDGTWYDIAEGRSETLDLETLDESGAWRGLQWLNAFEILFFERPKELQGHDQPDDLLFFVVKDAYQEGDDAALLVRRKGTGMPEDLGRGTAQAERIEWCWSTLLNLVIQASFSLTVATCRRTDINKVIGTDEGAPFDATVVAKAVYASPMNVEVNLEGGRSAEERPTMGYPDISFAVEDFKDAFKSLVLSEPGWCYVVTLAATGGMALAATQAKSLSNPAPGSLPQPGNITQSAALPPVSIATLGYTDPLAASAAEAEADSLGGRLGALSLDRQDPGHVDTAGSTGATTPEGSRTDLSGAGAGKEGEKESQAFDDPLRRPTSLADISLPSRPQGLSSISQLGGDQLALGSSDQHGISTAGLPRRRQSVGLDVGKAGAAAHSLPVFTGFVSHEQLEAVIGNSWQRKAAVKAQSTHWVKMRGPGGQGHADCAMTCLAPLDEGHLAPPCKPRGSHTRQPATPFGQAVGAVARSAVSVAKGLVQDALGERTRTDDPLRLQCALMRLSLPIDLLAAQLLQLPPVDP